MESERAEPAPATSWSALGFLTVAGLLLILLGAALTLIYCEYRADHEVQQATRSSFSVSEQCMGLLKEVVPVTIILARNESHPPQRIALAPAVRDSLRDRRWTTP